MKNRGRPTAYPIEKPKEAGSRQSVVEFARRQVVLDIMTPVNEKMHYWMTAVWDVEMKGSLLCINSLVFKAFNK
jgi:hypothetical protein